MTTYHFEKLTTLRVYLDDIGLAGLYALVVPDPVEGDAYRAFYLVKDSTGQAVFMFGVDVKDDNMAAELAAFAAPQYAPELEEVTT